MSGPSEVDGVASENRAKYEGWVSRLILCLEEDDAEEAEAIAREYMQAARSIGMREQKRRDKAEHAEEMRALVRSTDARVAEARAGRPPRVGTVTVRVNLADRDEVVAAMQAAADRIRVLEAEVERLTGDVQ